MPIRNNLVLYFLTVLFLVAGCTAVNQTSQTNLAFLYQPEKQFADLDCAIYHTTDTTSDLFVRVNFSDLVYFKDPFTGVYTCKYRISCKLKEGYESGTLLAVESELAGDSIHYGQSASTVHSFVLPARIPNNYVVEVELFDLNRNASSMEFVSLSKSDRNGRQNFISLDLNGMVLYRNYLFQGESFRVLTNDPECSQLFVSSYHRDFPIARPPYTEDRDPVFEHRPDSLYTVALADGQTPWMEFHQTGFYHFRKDTTQREGFTLFVFDEGFPEIITAEQLREPLRYITARKEYDSLMDAGQAKAAVDDFWLRTAGSPERARVLIQKYYGNVEESNRYFTSYMEGWKTDRGLIYTVLGKPNYVYRSDKTEEWTYGEPQNRSSLMFTFVRVRNPFTDNDFMLLRSPTFKEPWFITVQSWRR
jgi:GWxTD domain-containing protein